MTRIVPGVAYFAVVFALGFVLGTVRTILVPEAGGSRRLLGVLVELPVMLAASWLLCAQVIRRLRVPPTFAARAAMGALAFGLLMVAELLVGVALLGRSPREHFALYGEASYAIGLLAQVAFGLMPVAQMKTGRPGAPAPR